MCTGISVVEFGKFANSRHEWYAASRKRISLDYTYLSYLTTRALSEVEDVSSVLDFANLEDLQAFRELTWEVT
jgi:hypothetical protein